MLLIIICRGEAKIQSDNLITYSTKSNSKFTAKNLELLRVTLLKVLKTNGKPYHSKTYEDSYLSEIFT